MSTPMKLVHDCATNEATLIPFTAEEIAAHEATKLAFAAAEEARVEAAEALAALKASAKAKLIAGQPLTAEEADTLVI
jgi:hypothetical protein